MSNKQIPLVDQWKPNKQDIIFTNAKNIILAPLDKFYHLEDGNNKINFFMVNPKKGYNSNDFRDHCCLYLNYFEKFFDTELEYFTNLAHIKFFVDAYPEYNYDNLIWDLNRYILQPSIFNKVIAMTEYNYMLSLDYKSKNNPQLQYTDEHCKTLLSMSLLMNLCIPIITHFAYMRRVPVIDEFLLDIYDHILFAEPFRSVDIVSKLYQTAISNVMRNERGNAGLWSSTKQDIRGKDTVTHSKDAERNIILTIMPKYTFNKNPISLNYTSINKTNKYKITDASYELNFINLSSSKRESENSSSEMDKFEANLIRTNEAKYLQVKVNAQYVLDKLDKQYKFREDEINFFLKNLRNDNGEVIIKFQKQLIFNLFYKYFGDTVSINAINVVDYVKLMLASRQILKSNGITLLSYILSSKVNKIVSRKMLNKEEMTDIQLSPFYQLVVDKYRNEKILEQIFSVIATIITSDFSIIDYENKELHGKKIKVVPRMIFEEYLLYVLLI